MHLAARLWGEGLLQSLQPSVVVEFGSRDVNGSLRNAIEPDLWYGIDIAAGPGVDLVMDAANFNGDHDYQAVVCTEVLEHAANWPAILASARLALVDGGFLILTCANHLRKPHSGVDGNEVREGEHYGGLTYDQLREQLTQLFDQVVVIENATACDLYALATA